MMKKSRERKYVQSQVFQKQLINSISDVYYPEEAVKLDEIDGLTDTLNSFIESPIPALIDNMRKYKIFRFITLIFMAHNKEVILNQYNNRIPVEKVETV